MLPEWLNKSSPTFSVSLYSIPGNQQSPRSEKFWRILNEDEKLLCKHLKSFMILWLSARVPCVATTTFTLSPLPAVMKAWKVMAFIFESKYYIILPQSRHPTPAHLLLCRPRRGCWPSAGPAPSSPPASLQVWLVSCWPQRGWFWTEGSATPPRSALPRREPRGCHLYPCDRNRRSDFLRG